MPNLLTEKEICEVLGLNRVSLQRWRKQGMPFKSVNHIKLLYDSELVSAWIASHSKRIRGRYSKKEGN